ncbi:MAG: hypothetical protein CMF45_00085 [Legionellales bacterium]|nr:hypothetical protein [Legionellales bacterium]
MLSNKLLLFLLYIYSINGYINTINLNNNINLKSNVNKNNNINFLIWKGFSVPSKNYIEFSKSLIKEGLKKDFNINITICNNYNFPVTDLNNTILFGHSSGGYHCLNNNNKLKAKITYGSSPKYIYDNTIFKINNNNDIDTLNIIGEYDGFISYNKLLDQIYYNINNNIKNNKLICSKSNHFCIVENKKTFISSLLCMYDHKLNSDYTIMTKDVINVIITYILYLNNNKIKIHNCKYTDNILSKNNIYEVDNYKHFLRTKPDLSKTYMFIDNFNNYTYIKTAGIFGDMLLDTLEYKSNKEIKEVTTTLEWLFNKNKDNDIFVFNYKKKNYKYFKFPYIIK